MKGLASEYLSSDVNEKSCNDTFSQTNKKMFTHGSRRNYYNGILEDYGTLRRRKLHPLNQQSLPKESQ